MKEKRCTGRLHMGGFVTPICGEKALMGDSLGGHRPNFDRLYHKLKVLLMLYCNYMMQFISYDSIETH